MSFVSRLVPPSCRRRPVSLTAPQIGEPRLDTGMRPISQSIASTIDSAPSARSFASSNIHTPLLPEEICWILDRVWGLEMEYHTGNLLAHTVFTFLWVHEGGGRVPFPEAQSNQGPSPSNHGPSPYGLDRLSTDTASFSSSSTPFSTPTSLRTRFAPAQVFRPITAALLKSVDLAAVVMEGNLVDVSRSSSLIGSCFFSFLRHSLFDFFVTLSSSSSSTLSITLSIYSPRSQTEDFHADMNEVSLVREMSVRHVLGGLEALKGWIWALRDTRSTSDPGQERDEDVYWREALVARIRLRETWLQVLAILKLGHLEFKLGGEFVGEEVGKSLLTHLVLVIQLLPSHLKSHLSNPPRKQRDLVKTLGGCGRLSVRWRL
ncbi:hypothetical protein C8J56DRAFT_342432 [Mycena floridula]|nr:hypothetical protein C8J56DRAFT_342432 [Mycena floridula]